MVSGVRMGLGLACALGASAALAQGSGAVWAIGLPHGYIVMEQQARSLEITSEHVAQGFVTVPAATRIVVTTRSRGDYALHFAPRGRLFQSVRIEGIGKPVAINADGGTVEERDVPAGRSEIALTYRFALAPGTQPGRYPWPLEVVARSALPEGFVASGPGSSPDLVTVSERAPR